MKNVSLTPGHIDNIVLRQVLSYGWEDLLGQVEGAYGKGMLEHVETLIRGMDRDSPQVRIVLEIPDSVCNPKRSTMCQECLASYGINETSPSTEEKVEFRRYRLRRIRTDERYRKLFRVYNWVDAALNLLYYDLEPTTYPFEVFMRRVSVVAEKCSSGSIPYLPYEAVTRSPEVLRSFSQMTGVVQSGIEKDIFDSMINEKLRGERITEEEMRLLESRYAGLFTTVGSDGFYHEFLKTVGWSVAWKTL
jgi:hypothetical protein